MMGKKYLYMTILLSPSLRQIDSRECERRHAVRRETTVTTKLGDREEHPSFRGSRREISNLGHTMPGER
jgi:hypothetical protein